MSAAAFDILTDFGTLEVVEGYSFVPAGDTVTRDDGVVFSGEMGISVETLRWAGRGGDSARRDARADNADRGGRNDGGE